MSCAPEARLFAITCLLQRIQLEETGRFVLYVLGLGGTADGSRVVKSGGPGTPLLTYVPFSHKFYLRFGLVPQPPFRILRVLEHQDLFCI